MLGGAAQPTRRRSASLDAYLYARSVPAPDTLFAGIAKLPAAHRAEISGEGSLRSQRYWEPPEPDPAGTWTRQARGRRGRRRRDRGVERRLVADVPVGAYLSGGVDSSLIVAKIAALAAGSR